jgi:hypothetical protein
LNIFAGILISVCGLEHPTSMVDDASIRLRPEATEPELIPFKTERREHEWDIFENQMSYKETSRKNNQL